MVWTVLVESGGLVLVSPIGSERLHIARSIHTVKEYSCQEWQISLSTMRQSGTILLPLT